MAQNNNESSKLQSAAERDAQFLKEHPVEGKIVQTGAALTGAGEAVVKASEETIELIEKTYTPGDMNPANMPHPLNAIKQGVSNLTEPGDMRIANAPHPINNAVDETRIKLNEMHQAGAIEGTRIGAAVAVGAVIDNLGPKGKLKAVGNILDEAGDASKANKALHHPSSIEGEYLSVADNKGIANKTSATMPSVNLSLELKNELQVILEQNRLSRSEAITDKVKNPVQAILSDPKNVLLQTAHDSKPTAMNQIDARYHGNRGDEGNLLDEHSLKLARAQQWASLLDNSPELTQTFKGMDKKGANALLNDERFDKSLGITQGERQLPPPMTAHEEKLASSIQSLNITRQSEESLQNAIERQANRPQLGRLQGAVDTLTQVVTPGAANTTGVLDRKLIEAQGSDSAVIKQMANLVGQKYIAGKAVVGYGVYKALDYATSDNQNEENAKLFKDKIRTPDGQQALLNLNKDFKAPIDSYNNLHSEHFKSNGALNAQAQKANDLVINKMSDQIQEKGLASFGELSKANEQHKTASQELH